MTPLGGSSGARTSYGTFGDTIDTAVGVVMCLLQMVNAVVLTG